MKLGSSIYLFLGVAVSKSFFATIRPINSDKVLKASGKSIVLTSNRGEGLAIFHVVTKKEKGFKLFGMKMANRRHLLLISPGSNQSLYLGYSKSRGEPVIREKKKYWEYKEMGSGGYILRGKEGKCLGVTGSDVLGLFECNGGEDQVFVFEKKDDSEVSESTTEDSHVSIISEAPQGPSVHIKDKSLEDFQMSPSSSDTDSDSSMVRPVFINLNVKDKNAYESDISTPSVLTSTITVSVTVTKPTLVSNATSSSVVSTFTNFPPVSARFPSSIASIWDKMASIEEHQLSCDSTSSSDVHRVPHARVPDENFEKIKGGTEGGLDLDFEFYPELGRLLKNDAYKNDNSYPGRGPGKNNKAIHRDKRRKDQILGSLECPDTSILNPLQKDRVRPRARGS
ncbi:hypothetical protein EHEL_070970 [Encephalitozoon hellem ATCC 50504]|uniref:Uncharacterized protein n=1 Tax=Encephalitozoon hellem TaxID=27973 RepID=A0A9Q9FBU0_ENCHE|nr:uncharacterized protein EHEL_070970 [Encephalitozoon hellem ATCC 50504]AFM98623.1 hypothetical protein EHEL_070970 [Encephalitozoon hellem ATCC 50504]UTX43570.1 hypothetical protein GPU96_07g13310 [Encephalitozoon hellem]|eukprot:XP_003887604.1 hypothetical protein EHEL_070970 [Encephalitozoon hellem ATCC 50504]